MQGAMWMQPLLPTLPVTFDAAEALRQAAQRAVPLEMEMTKTMFLLMILGPWRPADVLAMCPQPLSSKVMPSIVHCKLKEAEVNINGE